MKKILFTIIMFLVLMMNCKASCSYSEEKQLNTMASYVDSMYVYNEETKKFDITIYNVNKYLRVIKDYKVIEKKEDEVYLSGSEGETIKLSIKSSGYYTCSSGEIRSIKITLPYLNVYYGDKKCADNMDKSVCYSKYLSYPVTETIFNSALNPISFDTTNTTNIVEKEKVSEFILDIISNYWDCILISIVSTVISILIGNKIYVKDVYKL